MRKTGTLVILRSLGNLGLNSAISACGRGGEWQGALSLLSHGSQKVDVLDHMSYSLSYLKGCYIGDCLGDYFRGFEGGY